MPTKSMRTGKNIAGYLGKAALTVASPTIAFLPARYQKMIKKRIPDYHPIKASIASGWAEMIAGFGIAVFMNEANTFSYYCVSSYCVSEGLCRGLLSNSIEEEPSGSLVTKVALLPVDLLYE